MTSVHFISLGCPKNLVDSEVMLGSLLQQGFTLTEDATTASVIIVNTCAFIEDAKKEAIDTILEMARQKADGCCQILIVAGCLPQRYSDEVATLFPEVDLFVGAGEFPRIAEYIREWKGAPGLHVGTPTYLYDHAAPRLLTTRPHMAYIKIAEGCFHPCSFCIIPRIRGAFRSRLPESIVHEAQAMQASGVRELNLIAQDSTAYGRDIGSDIASLLQSLAALPGEKWIRLLYAYPHAFPEGVIEVMREGRGVCRYLDLPIQHISDRILAAMRRKGGAREIRSLIDRLRKEVPGIALRTSLIVGFPGEGEREFEELLAFVREARFEHLGVFAFSPEEGTHAAVLEDRPSAEIAEDRRCRVMELQREISHAKLAAMKGERVRALVEGPSEESEHLLQARSESQAPEIDGVIYINEGDAKAGEFADIEITDAHDYDLVGRVVGE